MSTKPHPNYGNTNSVNEWNTRLFVTDWKPRSVLDYGHLNRIYAEHLRDKCNIEVIDLLEHPEVAPERADSISAYPGQDVVEAGAHNCWRFHRRGEVLKGLGLEPVKTQ